MRFCFSKMNFDVKNKWCMVYSSTLTSLALLKKEITSRKLTLFSMDNPRLIFKPPRRLPGDLQTLPTYPLMFSWPMNAYVRSRIISNEPCLPEEATRIPYKNHWQFQEYIQDNTTHPDFIDLRGGPANLKNVTEYAPHLTPFPNLYKEDEKVKSLFEECDYVVKLNKEKKLNEEWMKKFGKKYFYIVDEFN